MPDSAYLIHRPTHAEQETVLRWDREGDQVHVWSASPGTWRKLDRFGIRPIRETTCQGAVSGRCYRIRLSRFRWGRTLDTLGTGAWPEIVSRRLTRISTRSRFWWVLSGSGSRRQDGVWLSRIMA
jgi:hypothetical protein